MGGLLAEIRPLRLLVRVSLGDRPALHAALAAAPDALIVEATDVEHGAVPDLVRRARARSVRLLVRVPSVRDGTIDERLDAAMTAEPDGIVLTDAAGPADIHRLGAKLAVREAAFGLPDGVTPILASVADTARGCLALASFRTGGSPRLAALVCDPARLRRELRCGLGAPALVQARGATVLAGTAAGVPALLSIEPGVTEWAAALAEGFAGVLLPGPDGIAAARAALDAAAMRPSDA